MERKITAKLLSEYEKKLWNDEKSTATVDKYLRDARYFAAYAKGGEISRKTVLGYKAELLERLAPTSANSVLAALNTFFKFAGWQDLSVKQIKVQKKIYRSAEKELTREEYQRLVAAADRRLSLLIQSICGTGIRVSELEFITVEAVKRGEAEVFCKGKRRTVFIVSNLQRKLLKYCREKRIVSGSVFVTRNGLPINRSNIWREMKRLCRKTGILPEKVFPHNLRHLFARVYYKKEKDIAKLADILGHTNINTTRIYIISTGTEHRKQLESMRLVI